MSRCFYNSARRAIVTAFLAVLSHSIAKSDDQPGIDELVAMLQESESRIENLIVHEECRATQKPFGQDEFIELERVSDWIVTSDRRHWYTVQGDAFNIGADGVSKHPLHVESAFDGELARQINHELYSDGVTRPRGSVGEYPSWYTGNPLDVVLHSYTQETISAVIGSREFRVTGTVEHDGRQVVSIESEAFVNDGEWGFRYWIDPQLGLAVRHAMIYRPASDREWIEYATIVASNYQEVETGIWLPGSYVKESWGVPVGDGEPQFFDRFEGTYSDWGVNVELPDDQFHIEFDPESSVNDHRPGGDGKLLTPEEIREVNELLNV